MAAASSGTLTAPATHGGGRHGRTPGEPGQGLAAGALSPSVPEIPGAGGAGATGGMSVRVVNSGRDPGDHGEAPAVAKAGVWPAGATALGPSAPAALAAVHCSASRRRRQRRAMTTPISATA